MSSSRALVYTSCIAILASAAVSVDYRSAIDDPRYAIKRCTSMCLANVYPIYAHSCMGADMECDAVILPSSDSWHILLAPFSVLFFH